MTVTEMPEGGESAPTADELSYRLEQQRLLADFGVEALRTPDVEIMLSSATRLAAKGMRTNLSKVLCYDEKEKNLQVIAGIGWKPGVVGVVSIGADTGSPAGYAFQTGEAVISNQLNMESKFRTPDFMIEHGVRRAINILIQVYGKSWGVLEVDSTEPGEFGSADMSFMQGFANLIGVAMERQEMDDQLRAARKHQELLTREASHRVKNSLAIVSAMLGLQKGTQTDLAISKALADAQRRISTVATAHDLLWQSKTVGMIDLADIVPQLCDALQQTAPDHLISHDIEAETVDADLGITLGLLINELVTNAIKYAYPDRAGPIHIKGYRAGDSYNVEVADQGEGFPESFNSLTERSSSLGMRLIKSLGRQIEATVSFSEPGNTGLVTIHFPLKLAAPDAV
ncbi:MAG: histidine kinase dimerization/phosphoacceptor domain -containing protein [Alteraurantiacibacter sp.]